MGREERRRRSGELRTADPDSAPMSGWGCGRTFPRWVSSVRRGRERGSVDEPGVTERKDRVCAPGQRGPGFTTEWCLAQEVPSTGLAEDRRAADGEEATTDEPAA